MSEAKDRPRILVLFGGRSAEHDVSIMSAGTVVAAMDECPYEAVPVCVDAEGCWRFASPKDPDLRRGEDEPVLCLLPGGRGRMISVDKAGGSKFLPAIDAIFPLLHGQWGEDGSVQGLASVARVPLVGCGIAGSANALDKGLAKRLLSEAGLPTAQSVTLRRGDDVAFEALVEALGAPFFLKPATQGSSVGVGKIATSGDFDAARTLGFQVDHYLIAEEFIDGREIECAVLEDADGHLFVSQPGEIATGEGHGFYTYEAKYLDPAGTDLLVPAPLTTQQQERARSLAADAFQAVGCDTMARVDMFLTDDNRLIVNELNTTPGFTDISMYPTAMAASGLPLPRLIDRLIDSAITRFGAGER